ncbi:MAG: FAD-dependent monooxygenase [Pseudomonadota bacterium]
MTAKSSSAGYDVVVVGLGLVGAASACALASEGLSVAVIEEQSARTYSLDDDMRGLVLALSAKRLLERIGAWPALAAGVQEIHRVEVSDAGRFGSLSLTASEAGLPMLGAVCPADRLFNVLTEKARAAAAVYFEHSYLSHAVDQAKDMVAVEIDAGRQGRMTLDAKLLIAADGVDSMVREGAGIEREVTDFEQAALVSNVRIKDGYGIDSQTALERFRADGPAALLPLGDRRFVAVLVDRPAQIENTQKSSPGDFETLIAEQFDLPCDAISACGKRMSYPLKGNRAKDIVDERLVLLGNAANTLHPNGAQGLNLGLRDVDALTAVLGDRPAGIGAPAQLARYRQLRAKDHRRAQLITRGMAGIFSSQLSPVRAVGNRITNLLAYAPSLRRAFARSMAGVDPIALDVESS